MKSTVVNFFKNQNIFITGGTGFVGTALIEKILRTCKDVGTIYLLIRPKDGKSVDNRLQELTKNVVSFHFKLNIQKNLKNFNSRSSCHSWKQIRTS